MEYYGIEKCSLIFKEANLAFEDGLVPLPFPTAAP
jgi:hypothetical protein